MWETDWVVHRYRENSRDVDNDDVVRGLLGELAIVERCVENGYTSNERRLTKCFFLSQ